MQTCFVQAPQYMQNWSQMSIPVRVSAAHNVKYRVIHSSHVVHMGHPRRLVVAMDGRFGWWMHGVSFRLPHVSQYLASVMFPMQRGVSNRSLIGKASDGRGLGGQQFPHPGPIEWMLVRFRPVAVFSVNTHTVSLSVAASLHWWAEARAQRRIRPVVVIDRVLVVHLGLGVVVGLQFRAAWLVPDGLLWELLRWSL